MQKKKWSKYILYFKLKDKVFVLFHDTNTLCITTNGNKTKDYTIVFHTNRNKTKTSQAPSISLWTNPHTQC